MKRKKVKSDMKRNAEKVKFRDWGRDDSRGHIETHEYLNNYLEEYPALAKRFVVVNNHRETTLADRSFQVFTSNNHNRIYGFNPFSSFNIESDETPNVSQLDFSSGFMYSSQKNITLSGRDLNGNTLDGFPIGFVGEVNCGGNDYQMMIICDISHRLNTFGRDVFRGLTDIASTIWTEIDESTRLRDYPPSTQPLTLGMDAEFELMKNRRKVDADDYFSFEGEIGTDGHPATLELRPHYTNTSDQLVENLEQLFKKLYNDRFEIETSGSIEALGAHIHFGIQRTQTFVQLMDNWVARPLWHLNGSARSFYQRLSECRDTDTHPGWEYRSLPSGILKDKKLASIVLKVVEGLAKDFYLNRKEISLHPYKEDYLLYLSDDEWKRWQQFKKDNDKSFKAESWGCRRKGSLYQHKHPGNIEIDIPIEVYLYKLRKERGNVFYLRPFNSTIRDYFLNAYKNKFRVQDELVPTLFLNSSNFYSVGIPYEIHGIPSEHVEFLGNFIAFLNSSKSEDIPEL